jgi:hypothetical protein
MTVAIRNADGTISFVSEAEAEARQIEAQRQSLRTNPITHGLPDYAAAFHGVEKAHREVVEAVKTDESLAEDYRSRRLAELEAEHRPVRDRAVQAMFAAMDEDLRHLDRVARRTRQPGTTQDEAARAALKANAREALRDEFRNRTPSLEMYEEVLDGADGEGDPRIEVFEEMALHYMPTGPEHRAERERLSDAIRRTQEARMSDLQRAAAARRDEIALRRHEAAMGLAVRRMLPPNVPGLTDHGTDAPKLDSPPAASRVEV